MLKKGVKFENIIVRIKTEAIKDINSENSGFVFFNITQIDTAIIASPTIGKIIKLKLTFNIN